MKKNKKLKTLEEGISLLQKEAKHTPISIEKILDILSGKGRALVLIFLSLPFCQPLQIPGLSIPFGLAIAFVGLRIAFGKRIWLPKSVLSKTITADALQKITDKALVLIKKMKRWLHPKLSWICHFSSMQLINGLAIFILGIFLALPLPILFSNLTAAWSIFLIALGILEDNGVFLLVGYLISLLTTILFIVIALQVKHIFYIE